MSRTLRALVLVLFAAAPSAAARVELVPETGLAPSAPSAAAAAMALPGSVAPSLLAPSLAIAPSAAPLAVAPAVVMPLAAAPAIAAPAAAMPAAPASPAPLARRGDHPTLAQTVAAPMPAFSKMSGGESSAAAEKDFAERAQLGAAGTEGTLALAASMPEPAPRRLHLLKAATPREAARAGNVLPFAGVDFNGDFLRAAAAKVAAGPAGGTLALDFKPGPKSLVELGKTDGILLIRGRADGKWKLVNAGAAGFTAPAEDFDLAVLGRASGSAAPSAADLRASEGRAARFAIASPRGLHEWNPDMPEGAGRALAETAWGRLAARAAGPFAARLLSLNGVASERRPWARVAPDWIEAGEAPAAERQLAGTIIPGWMRAELPLTAAKLGLKLSAAEQADILARSKVWVYTWHSRWTYEISGGLPDGHFDPKFGIRVMLKTDWRKLKDPKTHFRVLFAHEYTHWLQEQKLVTYRFGIEIPAVAVEQLRAMELVGWEGMKARRVDFIAEGNLGSFESGRAWARGPMTDETALMYRGVLGGVAYEVGQIAGRPEAAWEFLNLVIAEKGALKARDAFERVTGLRK